MQLVSERQDRDPGLPAWRPTARLLPSTDSAFEAERLGDDNSQFKGLSSFTGIIVLHTPYKH